jgi:hypothetical protein
VRDGASATTEATWKIWEMAGISPGGGSCGGCAYNHAGVTRGMYKSARDGRRVDEILLGDAYEDETASIVAETLYRERTCRFGPPERLLSDPDSAFTGDVMARLCTKLGIKKNY